MPPRNVSYMDCQAPEVRDMYYLHIGDGSRGARGARAPPKARTGGHSPFGSFNSNAACSVVLFI